MVSPFVEESYRRLPNSFRQSEKDAALRILTFASLFPNSLDPAHGIFIYQRSAHLAQRNGNEVAVVSPVPYFPRWIRTRRWRAASQLPDCEQIGNLTVFHPRYLLLPKISMPVHALLMFAGSLLRVLKLNRQRKIDCIDAHFVYPDGMTAVLIGKYLGIPVIVSARGTDMNVYPSFRLIRPMIRWTLKEANGIIAVSAALKESIVALGISSRKIHVIPNGVDTTRFQRVNLEEARQRLDLPRGIPLLVSVGALIPSKGHQLLIRALAQLAPRHPGLQLYILGEGTFRLALESLVTELGLQDRVHLRGKRPNEELHLWFSAAEASCLASAREGWPNVVTESLACGTPVVATHAGGIPEILHSEELGILVGQSVESISEGIEHALAKSWNRAMISEQTRARTWGTVAAEVQEVLSAQTEPLGGR
jgi:teichuronic acid biosynthesis glycosyltransferase TuaC